MDRYSLVSALCAVGGVAVSWVSLALSLRRKLAEKERELGTVLTELSFLKREMDEMHVDVRELLRGVSEIDSRIARIEESNIQTQKRMDLFDSRVSNGHDSAVS